MSETQAELDALLSFLLPFAEQMLEKEGSFHPFGALLNDQGEIEPITDLPKEDHPYPTVLLAELTDAVRARSAQGDVVACGLCADVKVVPPGKEGEVDAVRVTLEHSADDHAVSVFRPYTPRRGPLKIRYEDLFAVRSPREVLPAN